MAEIKHVGVKELKDNLSAYLREVSAACGFSSRIGAWLLPSCASRALHTAPTRRSIRSWRSRYREGHHDAADQAEDEDAGIASQAVGRDRTAPPR